MLVEKITGKKGNYLTEDLLNYNIFLALRYKYTIKNATTAPTSIPAVVSQKANCKRKKKGYVIMNCFQYNSTAAEMLKHADV